MLLKSVSDEWSKKISLKPWKISAVWYTFSEWMSAETIETVMQKYEAEIAQRKQNEINLDTRLVTECPAEGIYVDACPCEVWVTFWNC